MKETSEINTFILMCVVLSIIVNVEALPFSGNIYMCVVGYFLITFAKAYVVWNSK